MYKWLLCRLCAKWRWQTGWSWGGLSSALVVLTGWGQSGLRVWQSGEFWGICGILEHKGVPCCFGCLGPEWALDACTPLHPFGPVVSGYRRIQSGQPNACTVVPWLYRAGAGSGQRGWKCVVAALSVSQNIWIELSPMQSRWKENINYGILQHVLFQRVPADPGQHAWLPNVLYAASLSLSFVVQKPFNQCSGRIVSQEELLYM